MDTNIRRPQVRPALVAILLACIGLLCISPQPASAQGGLIVTITSPTSGSTVARTVTVDASVSSLGALVAGVQFMLDGANLGAEDTAAPYSIPWNTVPAGNGPHILTAVARDALGLKFTSDPVSVVARNTTTRFENTDLSITYRPGDPASAPPNWWHGSRSRGWSGKTASFNRSDGARATFTFSGRSVSWIGFRAPWAGIARVFVDGAFIQEIDLYSTTEQVQATIFEATGLAPGTHTIAVEPTGARNPSAADNAVVVDAFDVSPSSPPPALGSRVEQTSAAVSYTGSWTQGDTSNPWSGGTAASGGLGAEATFTFIGTSVSWVGLRGPQTGVARVFLDGAFQAIVDTASPLEVQGAVFSASSLVPAQHTLRIVADANGPIFVDAFDVRSRFEQTDPAVQYTGWAMQTDMDHAWSGTGPNTGAGSAAISSGGSASFTFSGTAVSWIGFRCPGCGVARVFVDDVLAGNVDTRAATEQVQVPVFTATGLASASHTLRIEATGSQIVVDAFDVTLLSPAPQVTRVQEGDPAITYDADWASTTPFSYWSGETVEYSTKAGAAATFSFTGTAVRWIGNLGLSYGVARVYLDGVFVAEVDTQAPIQEEFQAAVFSAEGLTAGTHTLRIEVTALKSPQIIIDAFDIWQ